MARRPDRDRATSGRLRVGPPASGDPEPRLSRSPLPGWLILCAVIFVAGGPARAARQEAIGLDELLYRSALIFEGVVTAVDITAGGDKAARTRVVFELARVLRGAADRSVLTFELPEGLLPDGRLVETAETPRFAAGERYVVFMRGGGWRLSPVLDWQQGVLRLATVGGWPVALGDSGRCVEALDRSRMRFGPRVAPRLQWPGFPTTTGADPPRAREARRCLPTTAVLARLTARLAEMGLDGPEPVADLHFTPRDDVRWTPTAAPEGP